MKKHAARRWLEPVVKYGIGFGLLAWVVSKYWDDKTDADTGLITAGLGTLIKGPIEFAWFGGVAALVAAAIVLQLFRWFLLVRALDLPFALRDGFRLGMVGLFFNLFLPSSVGGDVLKAYFIARAHPERKAKAVATVIADRAMGLFGLILFVAVLGSVAWALGDPRLVANPDLQWIVKVMGALAVGSVAFFLLLGLLPQRRVDRFAGRLKWVPKVGNSLAEMWYAVWMYRQRLAVVALGLVLSAGSHFALVFAFHCASRVFPPQNPATELATLSEHLVVAPIGFIVQAVPIAPGGVGVGEAAFAGLYDLCDRPKSRGIIARLSMRVVEWLLGLTGYIIYLRMRAEVREVEHEISDDVESHNVASRKVEDSGN